MSLRDVLARELADLRSCGERVGLPEFEGRVAWRCSQLTDGDRRTIVSEVNGEESLSERVRALIGELDREHRTVGAPEPGRRSEAPEAPNTPFGRPRTRARRDTHRAA